MPDTRTGPLVQKLADGLRDDMAEAVGHFQRGLDMVRSLEAETKGVNGLSSFLKSQANVIAKVISDLDEEAQGVEKKLTGTTRPEIKTTVDSAKAADVAAARAHA